MKKGLAILLVLIMVFTEQNIFMIYQESTDRMEG